MSGISRGPFVVTINLEHEPEYICGASSEERRRLQWGKESAAELFSEANIDLSRVDAIAVPDKLTEDRLRDFFASKYMAGPLVVILRE